MSKKEAAEKTLDEVTAEVYEAKVRDLLEKLQRYKDKCELLLSENDALTKAQTKFSYDKQDIVEFLNIKVHEHEEHITQLESKLSDLEEAKRDQELKAKSDFEAATLEWKSELDQCQTQSARYKAELDQLSDFKERKEDMENQLRRALVALEVKEKEYKDSIHSMERKMLQDKSQMKKEMLQKVNEAVANFRRVADQQMAETTKRAIRENMAITSQLKRMSAKTVELLADNESLTAKVQKLQISNGLLIDSEKDLAKKNQANQRVIKMLVDRLKESDEMLEMAFDANQFADAGAAPVVGQDGRRPAETALRESDESLSATTVESSLQTSPTNSQSSLGSAASGASGDVLAGAGVEAVVQAVGSDGGGGGGGGGESPNAVRRWRAGLEEMAAVAEQCLGEKIDLSDDGAFDEVRRIFIDLARSASRKNQESHASRPPQRTNARHALKPLRKLADLSNVVIATEGGAALFEPSDLPNASIGVQTAPVYLGNLGAFKLDSIPIADIASASQRPLAAALLAEVRPWGNQAVADGRKKGAFPSLRK